jgi:hypothetical protein
MLRTFKMLLPVTSKSVAELCGNEIDRCKGILLQAPIENTGRIYFGEQGKEFGFILNGGAAGLDVSNIRDIFVKGLITDYLIVIAY